MPPTHFPSTGDSEAAEDPTGGVPQPGSPHHLLRLCSKDDQLFISSITGALLCPLPCPSTQATSGIWHRLHTPRVGCVAPVMSLWLETATILFPFNSACVALALSSSPSPSPRAGPEFGKLLLFPPFPPPLSLHLIAALSRLLSCC